MVKIILSTHAQIRGFERGFGAHDVKIIAKKGKTTEIGKDGSFFKEGNVNGRKLQVLCRLVDKNKLLIITAYYEN